VSEEDADIETPDPKHPFQGAISLLLGLFGAFWLWVWWPIIYEGVRSGSVENLVLCFVIVALGVLCIVAGIGGVIRNLRPPSSPPSG
jgi:hypothetical protein